MEKIKGIYSDPSCYMVKDEEVDEYDKLFSPKIAMSHNASVPST